jgi:FemAB-related protein (PEP-CTERM system-associated)
VHELSAEWRAGWDTCVTRSPQGSIYHLASWQPIFAGSVGHGTRYLLAERGEEVVGVLPLVSVRSVVFGSYLVSLPWVPYGGPCVLDPLARQVLVERSIEVARRQKAHYIELHSESAADESLVVIASKVSMRRALPGDPDALWRELPPKLRSQIRRPTKDGLVARTGGVDQLDAFCDVYAERMRDLGTPVYPRRFFAGILDRFPDRGRVCCVYAGDQPVAAGLLLGFKDRLEMPWAASRTAFNRLSPNMLLYWQALRLGCAHGYAWFDFGRSTPGGSHYRFKAQWGAVPVPLYWQYWQPTPGPLPERNPQNPRYRLAIRAWRRLPLPVTRLLGPIVARSLG